MKKAPKLALTILLTLSMVFTILPTAALTIFASAAPGAANRDKFESQDMDVFEALGFDTEELPEGYDPNTTDNPYGRDSMAANQVFEPYVLTDDGYRIWGHDANISGANVTATSGSGANIAMQGTQYIAMAAGDFNNNGLPSEMAYVTFKTTNGSTPNLYLCFSDRTGDVTVGGGLLLANSFIKPRDNEQFGLNWQNLLQITAADYDGDGRSEIAVYVAENNNPRVDIYKLKVTSATNNDSWKNGANWERVWSRPVPMSGSRVPNMVSAVSGDFNRDGVDDLAIAYGVHSINAIPASGGSPTVMYTAKSEAVVLYGNKSGTMLQKSQNLNLGEYNVVRASFAYGDIDGDGAKELILGAQPASDTSNTKRFMAVYGCINSNDGIIPISEDELSVVDGYYRDNTWVSNNGFGSDYCSKPFMKANLAVFKPLISDDPYLYLDSLLISYTAGKPQIKYKLDENHYDENQSVDLAKWPSLVTSSTAPNSNYYEYGAISADITGDSTHFLMVNRGEAPSNWLTTFTYAWTMDESFINYVRGGGLSPIRGCPEEVRTMYGQSGTIKTSNLQYTTVRNSSNGGITGSVTGSKRLATCFPDTDNDTTLMRYTGTHYLTYSDPKVYAVLACSPYFQDIEDADPDYEQGDTTYTLKSGTARTDSFNISFELGWFLTVDQEVGVTFEVDIGFTLDYEKADTHSVDYEIAYATQAGEDAVVFYSIPTEVYVYEIWRPDGKGGYTTGFTTVQRTFKPATQVLSLSYYESIQGDYDALPEIAGAAVTHTIGDPSTYPSSTAGYNVICYQGNTPWNGISFGKGYTTESFSITDTHTSSYKFGAHVYFKLGGGAMVKSGAYTNVTPGGGYVNATVTGAGYTGAVYNMPEQFRDNGYYFAWKMFAYNYVVAPGTDNESSIPVISYVVSDVSAPPKLPRDFAQDYSKTTDNSIALTWSYAGSASYFNIYRYFDFPEGGGDYQIASVPASSYTLKYGADGKLYKSYLFEDKNLGEYTEYQYRIQVEANRVPPISALSALLTARTKTSTGYPDISLSTNNLHIYPDKNATVTASVTNITTFVNNTAYYQWQRLLNNVWTEVVGASSAALTFSNAGTGDAGEYRCRVNVTTKNGNKAISAFSETVVVSYSKRSVILSEIDVSEAYAEAQLAVKVTNAHVDSGSIPGGQVIFTMTGSGGVDYIYSADLDATGYATASAGNIPLGAYKITAYYTGSRIFKSASANERYYVVGVASGYFLDMKGGVNYGDTVPFALYEISNQAGTVSMTKIDSSTYSAKLYYNESEVTDTAFDIRGNSLYAATVGSYVLRVYLNEYTFLMQPLTIAKRPMTVQINNGIGNLNQAYTPTMTLVGGNADDARLFANVNTGASFIYTNAAGSAKTNADMISTPGYYSIKASFPAPIQSSYNITLIEGSYSVRGTAYNFTARMRSFEQRYVGKMNVIAPTNHTIIGDESYQTPINAGTRITLTAMPDGGFCVLDWYVGGVAQNNSTNSMSYNMLSENVTIEVQFVLRQNSLTYGADGNGTIACDSGVTSGSYVKPGSELSFTASPEEGYHFEEWRYTIIGRGTSYPAGTAAGRNRNLTVTMPDGSISVYAVFRRDNYRITLSDANLYAYYIGIPDGNTLNPPAEIAIKSGDMIPGDTKVFAAVAPGYEVDPEEAWVVTNHRNVEIAPDGTNINFTLLSDCIVSMKTRRLEYDVTINFNNVPTGSKVAYRLDNGEPRELAVTETFKVLGGQSIIAEVSFPEEYRFVKWDYNGSDVFDTEFYINKIGQSFTLTPNVVEKDKFAITFGSIPAALNGAIYSVSVNGKSYINIPAGQTAFEAHKGDDVLVKMSNLPSGKMVAYWIVDSQTIQANGAYPFNNIQQNHEIKPVDMAVSYNTISWPSVSVSRNGCNITPRQGFLTLVSTGSRFEFDVNNVGNVNIESVLVNGKILLPYYGYYVIDPVTENIEISIKLAPFGVLANGTDIAALGGIGWRYDLTSSRLFITSDNVTVSGAMLTAGKTFSIETASHVTNLTLQELTIIGNDDSPNAILANRTGSGTIIRFHGINNVSINKMPNTSRAAILGIGKVTLDGTGTLNVNVASRYTRGIVDVAGIRAPALEIRSGTVNITLDNDFNITSDPIYRGMGICVSGANVSDNDLLMLAGKLNVTVRSGGTLNYDYLGGHAAAYGIYSADAIYLYGGAVRVINEFPESYQNYNEFVIGIYCDGYLENKNTDVLLQGKGLPGYGLSVYKADMYSGKFVIDGFATGTCFAPGFGRSGFSVHGGITEIYSKDVAALWGQFEADAGMVYYLLNPSNGLDWGAARAGSPAPYTIPDVDSNKCIRICPGTVEPPVTGESFTVSLGYRDASGSFVSLHSDTVDMNMPITGVYDNPQGLFRYYSYEKELKLNTLTLKPDFMAHEGKTFEYVISGNAPKLRILLTSDPYNLDYTGKYIAIQKLTLKDLTATIVNLDINRDPILPYYHEYAPYVTQLAVEGKNKLVADTGYREANPMLVVKVDNETGRFTMTGNGSLTVNITRMDATYDMPLFVIGDGTLEVSCDLGLYNAMPFSNNLASGAVGKRSASTVVKTGSNYCFEESNSVVSIPQAQRDLVGEVSTPRVIDMGSTYRYPIGGIFYVSNTKYLHFYKYTPPETEASLSPNLKTYDLTLDKDNDLEFALVYPSSAAVSKVWVDGTELGSANYEISFGKFAIKAAYLSSLRVKQNAYTIRIDLSTGAMLAAAFVVADSGATQREQIVLTPDTMVAYRGSTVQIDCFASQGILDVDWAHDGASAETKFLTAFRASASLQIGDDAKDTITVTASYGTYSATCVITVKTAVTDITVNPATAILKPAGTLQERTVVLTANVDANAAHGADTSVEWYISGRTKTATTFTANGNQATLVISSNETGIAGRIEVYATTNGTTSQGKKLSATVDIAIADVIPVFIGNANLADGKVNANYTHAFVAASTLPVTFALDDGALPDGLSLASDGALSGTPTTEGTYTFKIKASNTAGSDTREFTLRIQPEDHAPTVADISIKSQPDKLSYVAGEALDLTGLAATLTMDDGTTQDVDYADFAAFGIAADYAQGAILTVSADDGSRITVTYGTFAATTDVLAVTAPPPGNQTVTFNLKGGIGNATTAPQSVPYGTHAAKPATAPTRTGYIFSGWYSDDNYETEWDFDADIVDQPITLYAMWTRAMYIVTFNPNGGTRIGGGELIQAIPHGTAAAAPTLTRSGYTFDGWDKDFVNVIENLTVNARWKYDGSSSGGGGGGGGSAETKYTVTFDLAGGTRTGGGELTQSIASGASAVSPTATRDGYLLDGWDGSYENVTADIAVKAIWKLNLPGGDTYDIPDDAIIIIDADSPLGYYIKIANPFEDVHEDDWFYDNVMFAYSHGLMIGTSTDPMLFSPYNSTTRGMIVTILYRLAGSPGASGQLTGGDGSSLTEVERPPFTDVAEGMWYTAAIKWAAANGIVLGYGDGRFGPMDYITREQLAAILDRYATFKGLPLAEMRPYASFTDATDCSDYARAAIARLYKALVIEGKPNNRFDPKGKATRAEAAAMLMRFIIATRRA